MGMYVSMLVWRLERNWVVYEYVPLTEQPRYGLRQKGPDFVNQSGNHASSSTHSSLRGQFCLHLGTRQNAFILGNKILLWKSSTEIETCYPTQLPLRQCGEQWQSFPSTYQALELPLHRETVCSDQ